MGMFFMKATQDHPSNPPYGYSAVQTTEGGHPPPPPQGYHPVQGVDNQHVTTQPIQQGIPMMMMPPGSIGNVPHGLEYLMQVDQLLVKQKKEVIEMVLGFETNNKYVIYNVMGQQVYVAKEDTNVCLRMCCGAQRPFTVNIYDNMETEIMKIIRHYKCVCFGHCCSCSSCCQAEVEIQSPPGTTVGFVKQTYSGLQVKYALQNEEHITKLMIFGPKCCRCYCPGDDIPFELMTEDGVTSLGRISKQWSNLLQEAFTDADNFGVKFPLDLDVKMKAVVLGAVFLIDFMFFEKSGQKNNQHH